MCYFYIGKHCKKISLNFFWQKNYRTPLLYWRGWGTTVCMCYWQTYFKHITFSYGRFTVNAYKRHKAHSTMSITWTKTVSKSNCALLIYTTCTRTSGIVPSLTYCALNYVCRIGTAHNSQQTVPQLLTIKCGSSTKRNNSLFPLYNEGVLFQFIIRNY